MIMKYALFLNGLRVGIYDLEGDARMAFLEACSMCNFEEDVVILIDTDGDEIARF